jgi:nitrogen fixation NifU-like protein
MYSAQLLKYFEDSHHAGEVSEPNALAQVENPVCGDVLRLTAKINDGKIAEMKFKAKGCVPAMACASALADCLEGRSVEEADTFSRKDLVAAVGGLPEASTHAGQLAIEALAALLKQLPR